VASGTNITLRAGAIGTGALTYQWLRNGFPVSDATNAILVLRGVQVEQSGNYALRISDGFGTTVSDAAPLVVAVLPSIAIPPQSTAVAAGGTVVFSVSVNGTGPFTYRWKKGTTTVTTLTLDARQSFFGLSNVQAAAAATYSVVVGNVLGNSRTTPTATLSVIADSDGDGIPDAWETAFGLDPRLSDSGQDPDSDGLTNLEEYLAGTDPQDAASEFRLRLDVDAFQPLLEFSARSNRTYSVQYKETLESPQWLRLQDVVSQPLHRTEQIRDATASPTGRFYRLVTPVRP
jgi:hypothetical protein